MNIAVLIKQVPIDNKVSVDPQTHALVRSSAEGMINPSDLNAIEAALALRDQAGGKVVVFTMGPSQAESVLREAMALGCDEACLVSDRVFAGADTLPTARVLARAVEHYGKFDLVTCGALSADGATGQVGPMVAEVMGFTHVSEMRQVTNYDQAQNTLDLVKDIDQQTYKLRVKLPALLTYQFGSNVPRLATLRSTRAAKKKEVTCLTNAELQIDPSQLGAAGSPSIVVDSWEPSGGKRAEILEGSTEELARQLHQLLEAGKGGC